VERFRVVIDIALVFGILCLGGLAWSQHGRLAKQEETLAKVEARLDGTGSTLVGSAAVDPGAPGFPERRRGVTTKAPPADGAPPLDARTVASLQVAEQPVRPQSNGNIDLKDPVVRTKLREVIAEEQGFAREERWQKRAEKRAERLRERIRALGDKTGMDLEVQERVADLLLVEQTEVSDLFRQAREDMSFPEARDKATEVRKETDAKAKDILDREEYAEYEKMREEETNRWRGGGRRAAQQPAATKAASGPRTQ